jgi:hypothetical protein
VELICPSGIVVESAGIWLFNGAKLRAALKKTSVKYFKAPHGDYLFS